ncbi:hypothetical protein THASP1DRAFT_23672 [Thamnocephalis sphaerospora]|uniref:Uncharacterized protein n=1 Tax=Thamnocephalis sphaerospora TaxID=78915 RepID=A0A4P9XQJ3_9FUNG|nr:hypothetical protein THASP1DRAFT_23672 [Thamnocephalis sphaerospora]|eukprot:RKP08314.1 hypothetical protein THASP1DRAFT_23672 [Thamnocephalis sphaerospora]
MKIVDFFMAAQDQEDMRNRFRDILMQFLIMAFIIYLFVYNFIASVSMVRRKPSMLASWCCLVQTFAGVVYGIVIVAFVMPDGVSCRYLIWYAGIGLNLSTVCVGITLLQRAYLVHGRSKYLLMAGILLMLPQPITVYYAFISPVIMMPAAGCISYYPPYLPWIRLAVDAPINILFSVAFITVVYRQYRLFGSAAWAHLVRNGIQTMCAIVLSNIICVFGASFARDKSNSAGFVPINTAAANTTP